MRMSPISSKSQLAPLVVDRNLLNPKFEGYQLVTFDEDKSLLRFPLPASVRSLPILAGKTPLAYAEVQSRLLFNNLFAAVPRTPESPKGAFFVDSERHVVHVEFDPTTDREQFSRIFRLLSPPPRVPEERVRYPSVRSVSPTHLVVVDGHGAITILEWPFGGKEAKPVALLNHATLEDNKTGSGEFHTPCTILDARVVNDTKIVILVQSTHETRVSKSDSATALKLGTPPVKRIFTVSLIEAHFGEVYGANKFEHREIHSLTSTTPAMYAAIEPSGNGYVIGSDIPYANVADAEPLEPFFDTQRNTSLAAAPYFWMQTPEDITVCFSIPFQITKNDITCSLTRRHFSLRLLEPSGDVKQLYTNIPFFDNIKAEESYWTFEAKGNVLTLYIQKQNEKTRWSHVFENDDNVTETIDANEFSGIIESLAKYTAPAPEADSSRNFQQPLGQETEAIDYEQPSITFSRYSIPEGNLTHQTTGPDLAWICSAFPQANSPSIPSVCLKHDVDGLTFGLDALTVSAHGSGCLSPPHEATFDAFAFVQASKRERKFIHNDPRNRYIVVVEGRRRVYVYWQTEVNRRDTPEEELASGNNEKQKKRKRMPLHAKSTVIDLGGDQDVLGVQQVGDNEIVVLLEREMVLLKLPKIWE